MSQTLPEPRPRRRQTTIFALAFLLALWLLLEHGFGYAVAWVAVWFVAGLTKIVTLAVRLIAGRKSTNYAGAILWAFTLALPVAAPISRYRLDRAEQRAEAVFEAVRQHKRDHGHSPWTLAELVPEYLEAVPSPGLGLFVSTSFDYKVHGIPRLGFDDGLMTYYQLTQDGWALYD